VDVRKVLLEQRPGLTVQDETVAQVRRKLFGSREMNWLPYLGPAGSGLP
jgi:hypothetical protein